MIDAVALRFAYVAGAKTTGAGTRIFIACASQNFPSLPRPHLKTGGREGAGGIPLGSYLPLLGRGCKNYGHRRENTRRRGKTRSVLRRRFTEFPECPPGAGAKIILTLVLFFP